MIGGPLDPENVKTFAPTFTPAGARFMLETCIYRKIKLDGDTILLLREIAKADKPDWEPRTGEMMLRAKYEAAGVVVPPPRPSEGLPGPEGIVDVTEKEIRDEDEEVPL